MAHDMGLKSASSFDHQKLQPTTPTWGAGGTQCIALVWKNRVTRCPVSMQELVVSRSTERGRWMDGDEREAWRLLEWDLFQ